MNDYAFGNFLYILRAEKGLSQAQLGEMLGVTNKAVSKWENGSAKPNTSLLPKIAEILGVTVEELFACKRIEKDDEYEYIKNCLLAQKRKFALMSSLFLSLVVTLPLFLFVFIYAMLSFSVPDDVAGPLGAMAIIFAFIASLTAHIIYQRNFRRAIAPSETPYDDKYVLHIRRWSRIGMTSFLCLLSVMFAFLFTLIPVINNITIIDIIVSILLFLITISFGIFICSFNIKRLLKIRYCETKKRTREVTPFKQWPLWAKICYVIAIILFGALYILASYAEWTLLWILTRILFVAFYIYLLSEIIKSKKK